jgi:uncharacterized repeat protein (TIGR03803 family)
VIVKNTPQNQNWISTMCLAAASAALALMAVLVLSMMTAQPAQAQTFTSLYSFCAQTGCPDGYSPNAGLVQGTDGNLYGDTLYGPAAGICNSEGCGTVFNITTSGELTTLLDFGFGNGFSYAPLILGTDGNFYGTTYANGSTGVGCCGTLFKITPSGTLTTLYSFCIQTGCPDGEYPYAGLIQATDGNFYGTTVSGGASNNGTVFKITPAGTLTTLYSFCTQSGCPDGSTPYGGLVQGTDGNFYGTTDYGGKESSGTVFKITPAGTLTTLYTFCLQGDGIDCPDGAVPGSLVQAGDGNFYGTTDSGGANCEADFGAGCGTAFKITPAGTLTTLYSFCSQGSYPNCTDGSYPGAGALIQAADGNLYGTTALGGEVVTGCTSEGCGTVFEITTGGALTTLHTFDLTDGYRPVAGLVQDTDGSFYGTTFGGGANSYGTVFSLSVGLGPFVTTVPTSGPVNSAVMILGTDLTGATSVSFNGTAATFTVASATEITTTVPAGATTGTVTVVTPSSGTLTSNLPFTVAASGPTTTTLASSLNPSTYNQSITFTATVTSNSGGTPTGTVTFTADGSNVLGASTLSGGSAAVSTSTLTAGTHSIVASYGGDSNDQPSTSTPLIQTVQMASSTLSIASNLDPSVYNQAVTFTVYISPQYGGNATGGVTFYNGTSAIGTAGVSNNQATLTYSTLPVGTDSIQGIYTGDSNVAGSASPVLFQVVNKATTTTAVASSLNPADIGETITYTATVTSQYQGAVSGTVDFKSGAVSLGSATLANGQASIKTSFSKSGTDSITAKYVGDANNTGSSSPILRQVVNKDPSTTALASSLNPSTVGEEVTFTATVTTGATGTVKFYSGKTDLGTVSLTGDSASLSTSTLTVGTHKIKAVYSGDGTFKGSSSPVLEQVVDKAD